FLKCGDSSPLSFALFCSRGAGHEQSKKRNKSGDESPHPKRWRPRGPGVTIAAVRCHLCHSRQPGLPKTATFGQTGRRERLFQLPMRSAMTDRTDPTALDARAAAALYLDLGAAPVPVHFRSKKPALAGWQRLRPSAADLDHLFPSGKRLNVGLLLGA